jgi:hypothetical protein
MRQHRLRGFVACRFTGFAACADFQHTVQPAEIHICRKKRSAAEDQQDYSAEKSGLQNDYIQQKSDSYEGSAIPVGGTYILDHVACSLVEGV